MQVQYDALYQNILTCPKKYPHVIVFDSSPMIGSPSSGSSPARYGHKLSLGLVLKCNKKHCYHAMAPPRSCSMGL